MQRNVTIRFSVCLFAGAMLASADTSRFEGNWADPQSHGVTAIEIRNVGGTLLLHAFGRCHPSDCDWGEVAARKYAPGVDVKFRDTVEVLSAEYVTTFAHTLLVVYPEEGDRLRVELFEVFTDSSGRLPYHKVQMLARSAVAHPVTTGRLAQPTPLSPADGSELSTFPRATKLEWATVPGAIRYGVEVDFFIPQTRKWASEVEGRMPWAAVVDAPGYTMDFVGAQPGRWRVWAIGPGSAVGPKTGWFQFSYTR